MMIELDPSDPLYDAGPPVKITKRIPRSSVSYAKVEKTTLTSRRYDVVYPPLTRLWLLLRIRSAEGQYEVTLTNEAVRDIGISRWQKGRLLSQLTDEGLILTEQRWGCCPMVKVLLPG
jgi:hypothetical protein